VFATSLSAQATGRIVGKIIDAEAGAPIAGAVVEVVGTQLRTQAAIDGRYTLANVPSGPASIRVRFIGFQAKVVQGIEVPAAGAVEQNVALAAQAVELEEITVAAAEERGSVNRALEEQRSARNVVSAITQEQISRSPDSDAGQAVQRVSGVTVQDGKYVFVRGLGERYTTTSLNGSRMPSPEPEKKLVPLDLFPSALLEGITTSKTFTPDQSGDFSGAQVDLKTREFPARRIITFSSSFGVNSAASLVTIPKAPTTGSEWIGAAGNERALPHAAATVARSGLSGVGQSEINSIIGSFRNNWSANTGKGTPNGSFGMSIGGEDPIAGQRIGYLGSLTYTNGVEVRKDERRLVVNPGTTPGTFQAQNDYRGETGRSTVLWGGMLNLSTRLGTGTKISVNNTYTRSGENEATRLSGFNDGFAVNLDLTRLTFTQRTVRSHQIAGQQLLGERHLIDWSASYSAVRRYEPDRSDLAYLANIDPGTGSVAPTEWFGAARSALRNFSDLDEHAYEGGANYSLTLGSTARPSVLKAGGLVRTTDRDAESIPFEILNLSLTAAERAVAPEVLFDGTYAEAGRLTLQVSNLGGRYTARDRLQAGFLMLDVPITSRVRVVGGARVEHSRITVDSRALGQAPTTSSLDNTDVLPSLAVNTELSSSQTLRLSASQTLSRPEYRELSPVQYILEPVGGKIQFGNPDLERARVQNLDARWEWYPRSGELVSIGAFYKHFDRPIERVLIQTSDGNAPNVTYQNARSARNYGVELELRKGLAPLGLAPLSLFANATLMRSRITVSRDDNSSLTNDQRPMVGQSQYVINSGLTYLSSGGISATALYNVVGRRILEAGILPLPDAYEEARHLIDLSIRVPVYQTLTVRVDAKNLLDSEYEVTQGTLSPLRYKSGRIFSGGFTWTP
jgi:outer membrane receptor protein involved in Fe transport